MHDSKSAAFRSRARAWARCGASLVIALPLVACGPGATAPAGDRLVDVSLAVGGQGLLVYLPTSLAAELGHYRDEGLNVSIQDFAGGARALQALLGGSADVVSGYYDHTIQMAAEGRRVKAFVSMLRYPGMVAIVSPGSTRSIRTLDDLRGAMVGVTSPGSSTHFFANHLLASRGLPPEAVSVTGIGSTATAVAAMERGLVDVGILLEPAVTELAARHPELDILADTRTALGVKATFGTDDYPAAVLYSTDEWIAEHADVAGRLARAMTRTLAWIQEHSAEEIAGMVPDTMRGDDPDRYLAALERTLPTFSPDGRLSVTGAEAVREVLARSLPTVREAEIDVEATFTNEFVDGTSAP